MEEEQRLLNQAQTGRLLGGRGGQLGSWSARKRRQSRFRCQSTLSAERFSRHLKSSTERGVSRAIFLANRREKVTLGRLT